MEFLSKYKKIFIGSLTTVCLAIIIVSIIYRTEPTLVENALSVIITPAQKAVNGVAVWISDKIKFLFYMDELQKENNQLKTEIEALRTENGRLRLAEKENQLLSALLKLDQKYADYPKIGAHIIAKDPGSWYDTFVIDKGTKDGVYKNMVVLANNGLAGKVIEAFASSAKVVSLVDDDSSVGAKSVRSEDIGYVRGDWQLMSQNLCRMDLIDSEAEIIEGDEIVTSNLSSIYPPGITIGYVKEVRADISGLTKYALITPVVNFKYMDTVLVITKKFDEVSETSVSGTIDATEGSADAN